ncbi:MAG: hypothetical protein O2800_05065, partial [Planctomycetota bacterium]|nr:hypothetical protein [Planctomycetota bacterium]
MLATPSILSAGWKNFKSAWPLLFAAFFFLAIAMVPLQLPIQVLNYSGMFQPASMPSVGTIIALAVCGILAQQFIMVPCFASVAMAGASAARLEPTRLKSILSAFSSVQRYGAVVGAGLIASLVLLPLTLLTLVPIVIAVAYGPGFTVDWWVWSQHINTLVVGYVATLVLGVCLLPLAIRLWVAP